LFIRHQLEQGELDLGIMITSNLPAPLDVFPITNGQIHVCLSHNDPLGEYASLPLRELRDHPFILFNEDTYIRQLILDECAKLQFSPKIVFFIEPDRNGFGLVEQGFGVSFFLEEIMHKRSEIVSRPLSTPFFWKLVWPGTRKDICQKRRSSLSSRFAKPCKWQNKTPIESASVVLPNLRQLNDTLTQ